MNAPTKCGVCGHWCCDMRDEPSHDHFLPPDKCSACTRLTQNITDTPDIEFLRALPTQSGICNTVVVPVPKLARDWLCDQAEALSMLVEAADYTGDDGGRWDDALAHARRVLDGTHHDPVCVRQTKEAP